MHAPYFECLCPCVSVRLCRTVYLSHICTHKSTSRKCVFGSSHFRIPTLLLLLLLPLYRCRCCCSTAAVAVAAAAAAIESTFIHKLTNTHSRTI